MTIKKLTVNEFRAIEQVVDAVKKMTHLGGKDSNIQNFFWDYDVNEDGFDGVLVDIRHDELYRCIQRYNTGNTNVVAIDTAGVGFYLIEILHHDYDNVFGFMLNNGEKEYYYCKSQSSYNDELERDETIFYADDEPLILEDFTRNC